MKIHVSYISIILVLACTTIYLGWQLLQYSMLYSRNVDYCSEFSFAYGYSIGSKQNAADLYQSYHHRLTNTNYEDNKIEVEIWPAKKQWLSFTNPRSDGPGKGIVDCSIVTKNK